MKAEMFFHNWSCIFNPGQCCTIAVDKQITAVAGDFIVPCLMHILHCITVLNSLQVHS